MQINFVISQLAQLLLLSVLNFIIAFLNPCSTVLIRHDKSMRSLTSNSKTLFAPPDYGDTFYPTYGQHYDNIMEAYRDNREKTRPVPVLKTINCFACVSSDPSSSCVVGNVSINQALYSSPHSQKQQQQYASAKCDGECYVKTYTMYGTEMSFTHRGCQPRRGNEICSHNSQCSTSDTNCGVRCCSTDWCNLSPPPPSSSLPLSVFLSTSLISYLLSPRFLHT
ncbi:uncharacterized protein LOC134855388 [Symsagittifera roscoffensis]|uniref:uncharacterized protein LOC134855388 n=1 Tax=Symsagittifera roscoffensis TaxID=84072 RepID=UPI00307BE592